MDRISFIGLPFYTGAKYRGMGMAVADLRSAGIADAVRSSVDSFNDLGDAPPSGIQSDSGPPKLHNFQQFLGDTDRGREMASKVGAQDFVFCLGGECSFTVGTLAAFKSKFKGVPGILWVDAHGDFNTPETTISGFIGGMPLAFACGRGPRLTASVETVRPILREENVVHLASRAVDPLESQAMSSSPMRVYSAAEAHKQGIPRVAAEAARYLADHCDWITCHLDVDSIDPTIMPAVDFPAAEGLTLEEVRMTVKIMMETGKLKVFDLAAFNSILDQDLRSATKLRELITRIFPTRN